MIFCWCCCGVVGAGLRKEGSSILRVLGSGFDIWVLGPSFGERGSLKACMV